MKNLYALLFFAVVCGCDDRFDFTNRDNVPPRVYFSDKSQTTLTDSLKLGTPLKIGNLSYLLELNAEDLEGGIGKVQFHFATGSAKIYHNEEEIKDEVNLLVGFSFLDIFPAGPGNLSIIFEARDNIGKSAIATFNLVAFDNLKPVASAILSATKITGPYEYEFDATKSFDRDRNFGGEILVYEYVINDTQTILTSNKVVKHNFPGPGGYRVKYRVHDNEGAASDFVTAPQITIQ